MRTTKEIKAEIAKLKRQLARLEAKKLPKMKRVRNLMNGEWCTIPVDTPYCCDPSQERYWTM